MSAGNVLKNFPLDGRTRDGSALVKRQLLDARAEAKSLLSEAEAQANSMRRDAEIFAREAREQAYAEGREAALLELSEDLVAAREQRETALARAEIDLLRLAVKIAEKILDREIDRSDSALADIVAGALNHVRQGEVLKVRVNPADFATIKKYRERFDGAGGARFIEFTRDPRVKRRGCLIDTGTGMIDAQLETQLKVLESVLLARAQGERR
jgi:flagellar biosynthesis/type III secretory pathway protein FliH